MEFYYDELVKLPGSWLQSTKKVD